ncbi:unnamed protein product [Effrenium voratum]|nr:unnamed protein product [Effrenium voratum]
MGPARSADAALPARATSAPGTGVLTGTGTGSALAVAFVASRSVRRKSSLRSRLEKRIIRESPFPDEKPVEGDIVRIHYVAKLSDGTCFDSSRARKKPFEFVLGESEACDGDSSSHPLGWSGAGPRRPEPEPSLPGRTEAHGWSALSAGEFREFWAAAQAVPEALPRPVSLQQDLRVVLNLKSTAAEVEVVSIRQETVAKPVRVRSEEKTLEADQEPDEPKAYDGAVGVIVSERPDGLGRWEVEATRQGVTHVLRVPGHGLLWEGAPVTVAEAEAEEVGLLAVERPERATGLWTVEVHKTVALLPANLRERSVLGFEERSGTLPLVRGVQVELCNLRAGAAYNGLSGVVLSSSPNARGRWEVAVKVPVRAGVEKLSLVGFKRQAAATTELGNFKPGDEVEIAGLVSKPQHNGERGVVVQLAKDGGDSVRRWRVQCGSVTMDLKEANLKPAQAEVSFEPMGLPGDGSDGRLPPVFRSSHERAEKSAVSQLGPRRGAPQKRPWEACSEGAKLDPMQMLEQMAEEEKRPSQR